MENQNNTNKNGLSYTENEYKPSLASSEAKAEISAETQMESTPVNHALAQEIYMHLRQLNSGATWINTIAAFSLINCVLLLIGAKIRFIIGLGITDIIAYISTMEPGFLVFAIIINILISALYLLFGYYAKRKHAWAFITTIVLYSIDSLLILLLQDWISLVFHGVAIFFIAKALLSSVKLKKLGA